MNNTYLVTKEWYSFWPAWLHTPNGEVIETIPEFIQDKSGKLVKNTRVDEFLKAQQDRLQPVETKK